MKIKFLKDITVDVICSEDRTNDTCDRLMREGVSLECIEVTPISRGFSNIVLDSGEVLVDLRNDSFEQVV
jgi:uncharacterized protein (DUF111 family)